jgi:Uma2 family endonuclease
MSSATRIAGRAPAVLYDIDWQTYTRLLRTFRERRLRLTYDRGTLEIQSPLWERETSACLLGRFVDVLTEEFQLPCRAGGSFTLRRKCKQRGLEPDRCYWIANAPRLLGKTRLNLRTDPPPDLAAEVDVTNSSLNRMSIYAKLRVPEVWRLDGAGLAFHILEGGTYQVRPHSQSFPLLASADLARFVTQIGQKDDTVLAGEFRAWVRQLAPLD